MSSTNLMDPTDLLTQGNTFAVVCGGTTKPKALAAQSWVRRNLLLECNIEDVEAACTETFFGFGETRCDYRGLNFTYAGIVVGRARFDVTLQEAAHNCAAAVPGSGLLASPREDIYASGQCLVEDATSYIRETVSNAGDRINSVLETGGRLVDTAVGGANTAIDTAENVQGVLSTFTGGRGLGWALAAWTATGLVIWKVGPYVLKGVERVADTAVKGSVVKLGKALK